MRRWIACLALAALLTSPAWCEQVYIRNKPFKGAVAGKGPQTTVDLASLVQALGMTLTQVNGNWVVTGAGQTASLPEGATQDGMQLYYQGKAIGKMSEGGATMVPLIATAQSLGAVAKHNKDMGSIDVNLPVGQMTAAEPRPASSGSSSTSTSSFSSKYKMVHFWASW